MTIKKSLIAQFYCFFGKKFSQLNALSKENATFRGDCFVREEVCYVYSVKMAQYTKEERVFMVKSYFETKSPDYVIDAFRNQFPNRNVPSKSNNNKNNLS